MTIHFRKIKETSANVLVPSIINMLQVSRKQRRGGVCVQGRWSGLVAHGQIHRPNKSRSLAGDITEHTRRWCFVVVALRRVKGGRFREPFLYSCQPNRSAHIRQRVEFFYFNPFTHWEKKPSSNEHVKY